MIKLVISLLICWIFCLPVLLNAQIITVASGDQLSVEPGTLFSCDSIIFTPSSKFVLSGVSLSRNYSVSNPTTIPYITKVYKFSSPTEPFSGTVQINYADSELNGLSKPNLELMDFVAPSWQLFVDSINNTVEDYVLSKSLKAVPLKELTLGACIPPASPTVNGVNICSGSSASLTSVGAGTLGWYDSATSGKWLGRNSTFTTPALTATTTYYLQDSTCTVSLTRTAVTVTVDSSPALFSVTGGGFYCSGESGIEVGLSGSQTGVDYQLKLK